MPGYQVIVNVTSGHTRMPSRTFLPGDVVPQFIVGSQGDWIISALGVAPQHLLLTFDGLQIHVASLGDAAPAYLKGVPLDKNWRIVPHLGEIRFGQASLIVLHRVIAPARSSEPPRPAAGPHNTQFFEDYQEELRRKQLGNQTRLVGQLQPYVHPPDEAGNSQPVLRPLPPGVINNAADPPPPAAISASPPPLLHAPLQAPQGLPDEDRATTHAGAHVDADIVRGALPGVPRGAAPLGHLPGDMPAAAPLAPTDDAPPLRPGQHFAEVPPLPLPSAKDDEEPFSTVYAGDELRDFVANIPPPPEHTHYPVAPQSANPPSALLPPLHSVGSEGPEAPNVSDEPSVPRSPAARRRVDAPRGRTWWIILLPLIMALLVVALVWFVIVTR